MALTNFPQHGILQALLYIINSLTMLLKLWKVGGGCAGLGEEQSQSRHLIENISGKKQQSWKPSFEKKALKPFNEENIGQPALPIHDIIFHFENIICKASYPHNEMFHNYVFNWGFCFAVWMCTSKSPTPHPLKQRNTESRWGHDSKLFCVCLLPGLYSFFHSSLQLRPCIWKKGLHTSFHLPNKRMNNHFDCLEVTKAPDIEFINPYPLPMIIHF